MIPYGHQTIDDDDISAVVEVLRGDWLTHGPAIPAFEEALAKTVGARFAVAFSSGTAALHAAMIAAGIGPGAIVVTSPLTFVASANCARYVGAEVALVDIDSHTLLMDLQAVAPTNCDAVVAVHYAGLPLDLSTLANPPPVVIEDGAHALGAMTPDGPIGNCAHSDMCMFSFHPVKHITTGEGGMITTNSAELTEKLRRARNHGIVPNPDVGGWYYEVEGMGFNYRMTDIQAALGRSQLAKLAGFVERRNKLAERYRQMLAGMRLTLPPAPPPGVVHAYHLFPIRVDGRDEVYRRLRTRGIGVQVHYVPVHHHPVFAHLTADGQRFPKADQAYEGLLSLPLFPGLSESDQDRVVEELSNAL